MDEASFQPTLSAAAQAAVADGRIQQEHADYLNAFLANPGAFSLGNIFTTILPIFSAIFPQFAPLFAILAQLFGGGTPTPTPTPIPAPAPGNIFTQIFAFIKSIFSGGTLPVPKPTPAPTPTPLPTGIVPPTPVP